MVYCIYTIFNMDESVVKLRVDSQEYDAKIRRAADGLRAFGENCQKAGQSVAKADKDTLEYVRSIGQMETVSKTVRGKIGEMTTAFTELSVQYKNLTDEEKKSQFGVALSQSLDQLKTRIGESKAQLQEVSTELGNTSSKSNETGGIMQQLAGKFSFTVDAMKLFNIGMNAVGVAIPPGIATIPICMMVTELKFVLCANGHHDTVGAVGILGHRLGCPLVEVTAHVVAIGGETGNGESFTLNGECVLRRQLKTEVFLVISTRERGVVVGCS